MFHSTRSVCDVGCKRPLWKGQGKVVGQQLRSARVRDSDRSRGYGSYGLIHRLARGGRQPCRIQSWFGEGLGMKLDGGGCTRWLLGNATGGVPNNKDELWLLSTMYSRWFGAGVYSNSRFVFIVSVDVLSKRTSPR